MSRRLSLLLAFCLAALALAAASAQDKKPAPPTEGRFIVHEWGTFLNVQGSDGVTLGGMVESEEHLPAFVIQRGPEGWERAQARKLRTILSKMETPVTYFYTDRPRVVRFKARMPHGLLTHWYPTVQEMHPAWSAGQTLRPDVGSSIDWGPFHVKPASHYAANKEKLALPAVAPQDSWAFLRQTDSAIVSLATGKAAPGAATEMEKFLFYRGLGAFDMPLQAIPQGEDSELHLTVSNRSPHPLLSAFLIWVEEGTMRWAELGAIAPSSPQKVETRRIMGAETPLAESIPLVKQAVARALVASGLYPKEANAMVDHWESSYFRTPGLRVLYLLPREQTDAHIPIEIKPAPTELVRTMVARLEIFTPEMERKGLHWLKCFNGADDRKKAEAQAFFAGLGRLRNPLLRRLEQISDEPALHAAVEKLLAAADRPQAGGADDKNLDTFAFVREAVLQGLKSDGVSPRLAAKLAAREWFVDFIPKCQTCCAVHGALTEYAKTSQTPAAPAVPQALELALTSDDKPVRHPALQKFVQQCVQRHFERERLTPAQRARIERDLQQERKEMINLLTQSNSQQLYCPSCDGSCGVPVLGKREDKPAR